MIVYKWQEWSRCKTSPDTAWSFGG